MNDNLEKVVCDFCSEDSYSIKYVKDRFNIVQCNNCDLVYVNPRLKQDDIYNLYNEDYFTGKGFDERVQYRKEFDEKSSLLDLGNWDISTIKEMLGEPCDNKSPKMLDVGCGTGLFLWKAKQQGFDVEGLELSSYASKFVESLGIPVRNKTIDDAELIPRSYDAIIMKEVIEHLPNPKNAFMKIYSSLKPGGVLFLTTGNYNSPERKLKGKNWFYFMPEGHIYLFSNKTMKNYLRDTGFSKIYITNQGDLLMNFLLRNGIIEVNRFKPKNVIRRILFESVRGINHFISSGMRIYAVK